MFISDRLMLSKKQLWQGNSSNPNCSGITSFLLIIPLPDLTVTFPYAEGFPWPGLLIMGHPRNGIYFPNDNPAWSVSESNMPPFYGVRHVGHLDINQVIRTSITAPPPLLPRDANEKLSSLCSPGTLSGFSQFKEVPQASCAFTLLSRPGSMWGRWLSLWLEILFYTQ